MDMGLAGKVALETGGARDVGREIGLALANEGAAVAINYRGSEKEANRLVAEIKGDGGTAEAYGADVSDYEAVCAMIDQIVNDFGQLDILVNNAGYVKPNHFVKTVPEEWHAQIDVGLYGVIHCTHAAASHLAAAGQGRIISLAGDSARGGEKGLSITAASRGGVLSLTKSLAKELGPDGITVNSISPGYVDVTSNDPLPGERHEDNVKLRCIKRNQYPDDLVGTLVYLSSADSDFVTGQNIIVDGGIAFA